MFIHPGGGKTRCVVVDLIKDGVAHSGKVYFTGPTLAVCEEAYRAIIEYPTSLCTSAATGAERGSYHRQIIIMARNGTMHVGGRGFFS